MIKQNQVVIVTPVYEDVKAASALFRALCDQYGDAIFIVAVDDGSVKQPLTRDVITNANLNGVVIKLKRNVGHQRAIAIGLGYVNDNLRDAKTVVVMDSDGEDTPASIEQLTLPLGEDSVDVVVAARKSRVESFKFKAFYILYKMLFQLLSGKKISFGNFMAIKPRAIERLVNMQELGLHVAATVLSSKLRIRSMAIARGPRYAGKSKMNFVGLVLHGFRGLMVFAEDVLVRVGIASAVIACFTIVASVFAVGLKLLDFATPGWFSVALGILFLVFLQTGTLTLMMLMLTGVVKNKSVEPHAYKAFISEVVHAKQ